MKLPNESVRSIVNAPAQYTIRLAQAPAEIQAAQALRFQVFNLELNEGLAHSYATGLDADRFDDVCDHLIVEHAASGEIVGTYRLQTGASAAKNLGYYCAQEFHFEVFEPLRGQIVELGRACVHRQHRNLFVLGLLWKGIADYARKHGCRYLIGCSSLTSQEPAAGASAYTELCRNHLAAPRVAHRTAAHARVSAGSRDRRTRVHSQAPARLPDHWRQNLRAAGAGPAVQDD